MKPTLPPECVARIREAVARALATGLLDPITREVAADFLVTGAVRNLYGMYPRNASETPEERVGYSAAWTLFWAAQIPQNFPHSLRDNLDLLERRLNAYDSRG